MIAPPPLQHGVAGVELLEFEWDPREGAGVFVYRLADGTLETVERPQPSGPWHPTWQSRRRSA